MTARSCRFESYWEHQYGEVAQRQVERHKGVAGNLSVHRQSHCVGSSPTLSSNMFASSNGRMADS